MCGPGGLDGSSALPGPGLLHDVVHDLPADGALDVAEDVALRVDHECGGIGADAVLVEERARLVHHHGIGVAVFLQEGGDVFGAALLADIGPGHAQHHQLPGVLVPVLIQGLDVRHLHLAGAAPSSPEVQKHRLPLVVREGVGLAVLVRQSEVRSGDHGDLLAVRPAVLLLRIAGGGRLFAAVPGGLFLHRAGAGSQICGDAAGGAGEGQDAHDDQQHRADLHRVAHHILVGLEEMPKSKKAILDYRLIGRSENYYLLEVDLKTGRHHQIRCQLAKMGCPIKGDLKYGSPRSNPDGSICLHARRIRFVHPVSKELIELEAPLPEGNLWKGFELF